MKVTFILVHLHNIRSRAFRKVDWATAWLCRSRFTVLVKKFATPSREKPEVLEAHLPDLGLGQSFPSDRQLWHQVRVLPMDTGNGTSYCYILHGGSLSVVFVLLALRVTVIITRLTGIFSARSSLLSGGRLALKGIVLFLLRFLMLRSGSIRQVYKGSSCYFIARQLGKDSTKGYTATLVSCPLGSAM